MEITTTVQVHAAPATVYRLAAAVERWPLILPHYRWVRVLADHGDERIVAMAARRDLIPVQWVARQTRFPAEHRIDFKHVGGITRGMDVTWRLTPNAQGVEVSIWHGFHPTWPLVPDRLVRGIVGEFFVDNIARKTLRRIKALAEAEEAG
jgi:ribosome-associated toxin RatA of RatAB toxin-antitoxin module